MKKPKTEKTTGAGGAPCVLVNNRYLIYLDGGEIYGTYGARDIPRYVFKIRNNYFRGAKKCI